MPRCAAIKANGERCASVIVGADGLCHAHSPLCAERCTRKRDRARAGRRATRGPRRLPMGVGAVGSLFILLS